MAGIPWRFSGHVRAVRPAGGPAAARVPAGGRGPGLVASTSTRSRRGEPYLLGGEDLTAIVNSARRRNRTRLGRPRGARAAARASSAIATGDPDGASRGSSADLRALHRSSPTSGRRARCSTRSCADAGRSAGWRRSDAVGAEEALRNIARFFDIVRAQSALLADDRATFVARHLQTLIEAGDDPPTADLDPDADAVAVLTVHKAKGLEFPIVFMPGLVAGRFPTHDRREPLAMPLALVERDAAARATSSSRRSAGCSTSAMTRARDELVLSHAADYGGGVARRLSPFVLEALDLPPQAAVPGAGATAATPLERIAAAQRP